VKLSDAVDGVVVTTIALFLAQRDVASLVLALAAVGYKSSQPNPSKPHHTTSYYIKARHITLYHATSYRREIKCYVNDCNEFKAHSRTFTHERQKFKAARFSNCNSKFGGNGRPLLFRCDKHELLALALNLALTHT
jgi:hypothetical protein